jgi:hypothetical protein
MAAESSELSEQLKILYWFHLGVTSNFHFENK